MCSSDLEALLKSPVANQPQQQQPQPQVQAQPIVPPPTNVVPQPPVQQQPNFQQKPAPIPQLPTPPPRVRGVIPKNPQATAVPQQAPTVAPTPEVEL